MNADAHVSMAKNRAGHLSKLQTLSIFPLTYGEWHKCGICWRSSSCWERGRTSLMWSPTFLNFCQQRTVWCVWSVVGKASSGMRLTEDCVGLAGWSSLSQQKGFSSWGCRQVRDQLNPVPTLCSAQKPQLMLQVQKPSGQRRKQMATRLAA